VQLVGDKAGIAIDHLAGGDFVAGGQDNGSLNHRDWCLASGPKGRPMRIP
jgi:hypothetical protein